MRFCLRNAVLGVARCSVAGGLAVALAAAAWADPREGLDGVPGEPEAAQALPEVVVKARRERSQGQDLSMDRTLSRTTIGAATLDKRQAATVFEVLDEVPGVAVNGGPRASGLSFNIRGYSDNEDVVVKVDGVVKGFEKYRFGGTFIEPDLLKSLEVRRGAQIESGAGALGGTVLATTKDAADLLRPGQRLGARLRTGWASNNDEHHVFATVYGRPSDTVDLLAARSTRQGRDLTLPGGERLSYSAVDAGSDLLKASWFAHEQWQLSATWLRYHDQGLQAYDATGGQAAGFGFTQRRIDDDTVSAQARWRDATAGHQWMLTLGRARTRVRDHFEPGMGIFANAVNKEVNDDIDYIGHTLDTSGRIRLADHPRAGRLDLHLGLQLGHSHRSSRRVTGSVQQNQSQYPGGFNEAQPPGDKATQGAYIQSEWRQGRWHVLPGVRWDRFALRAAGPTVGMLAAAGQSAQVRYERTSPSLLLAVDLVPGRWTLFAQAAQAFRPPLIDEVFSRSAYGACNDYRLTRGYTVPGYPAGSKLAPASGICGDLYRPETSRTLEWGVSTMQPGWAGDKSRLDAKLTVFSNRTRHLLESLIAETGGTGRLVQSGREDRHGVELEAQASLGSAFASLAASRIRGTVFDGQERHALTTVPGDSLHLGLGWRWPGMEAMLRWRRVSERLVVTGTTAAQADVLGTQDGYRVLGLSLRWQINDHFDAVLSGDNLENARYQLNNGFGGGIGTEAPGRNVRLSLTGRY